MRVTALALNPAVYSSNAYLVRGDRNELGDVNTLVDTGIDGTVVGAIRSVYTGAGKRPVEQVILTHGHFDHVGGVEAVRSEFGATILGSPANPVVERALRDGETVHIGDRRFSVLSCAEHSCDSILLFCAEEGILFSGDTALDIKSPGGAYQKQFLELLERLAKFQLKTVYPGHGPPIDAPDAAIRRTLELVRRSPIV